MLLAPDCQGAVVSLISENLLLQDLILTYAFQQCFFISMIKLLVPDPLTLASFGDMAMVDLVFARHPGCR